MIWQIVTLIALTIASISLLICLKTVFRLRKQRTVLKQSEQSLLKQHAMNKNEIEEVRAGLLKIGKHVIDLQSQIQELTQKQQDIQLADPESKIYSRAVKMISLGADIDEVIRECELPHAEAELLFTLHHKEK
jgi:uncharacterized membrane protein YhiD involved in acid resistance